MSIDNLPQFSCLSLSSQGTIWTLTVQRPEALNALNSVVLSEIEQCVRYLRTLPAGQLRVLIVTGAGEKAFVAGADIREMSTLSPLQAKTFAEKGQHVFRELETLNCAVIAAVNGFALGGGLELALSCDFIYASENAKLGLPEVSLGLIPGFGGTVRLSRVIGMAKASEWVLTGAMYSAQEALAQGLVNKVVAPADLMSTVMKTAELISTRGPIAVAHAKKSLMGAYDLEMDAALRWEASQFSELFASSDTKEGTSAFIEKRKPVFLGK